ncbi:MAG: hypothetical protein ACI81T_004036 [Bacteroidia bacterium]|jgi:hypothetical protein
MKNYELRKENLLKAYIGLLYPTVLLVEVTMGLAFEPRLHLPKVS